MGLNRWRCREQFLATSCGYKTCPTKDRTLSTFLNDPFPCTWNLGIDRSLFDVPGGLVVASWAAQLRWVQEQDFLIKDKGSPAGLVWVKADGEVRSGKDSPAEALAWLGLLEQMENAPKGEEGCRTQHDPGLAPASPSLSGGAWASLHSCFWSRGHKHRAGMVGPVIYGKTQRTCRRLQSCASSGVRDCIHFLLLL